MFKKIKNKFLRNFLRVLTLLVLIVVLFIVINLVYLLSAYKRIPDWQTIEPNNKVSQTQTIQTRTEYKALTYNTGFSAYTPEFSFFMDGGTESWAFSPENVKNVTENITELLKQQNADFISLEEVDSNGDRTYHIDETKIIEDKLTDYNSNKAVCFDCPFLFWPPWQPHGKNTSNIMTFSKFMQNESTIRRQLPVDEGVSKIKDYDRCYTITRYKTNNEKELVYITTHLSAYSDDPTTSNKQVKMLIEEMDKEYEKGNYVICAGDYNKCTINDDEKYFGKNRDNQKPFPYELLEGTNISVVKSYDENHVIPSCRLADCPLNENSKISLIDGFMVTNNIEVKDSKVINTNFAYSDHNPVYVIFLLR